MTETLETKIITELKKIANETRTCRFNISAFCVQTGPADMFKWAHICVHCDKERSRINAHKIYVKRRRAHFDRAMAQKLASN